MMIVIPTPEELQEEPLIPQFQPVAIHQRLQATWEQAELTDTAAVTLFQNSITPVK